MVYRRYLAVCDYAQNRSRKIAQYFNVYGRICIPAGFCQDAMIPLSYKLIDWADNIIVLSDSWKHDDTFKAFIDYAKYKSKNIFYFEIEDTQKEITIAKRRLKRQFRLGRNDSQYVGKFPRSDTWQKNKRNE